MITIRPYTADDSEAAARLRHLVFSDEGYRPPAPDAPPPLYIDDDRRFVAERDGQLVGQLGAWRMAQVFGGTALPMAGVGGVAVVPEARGLGVASDLLRTLLHAVHEQGDVISTLYPATVVPYRRAGWEFAGERVHTSLRTRALLDLPRPADTTLSVRAAFPERDLVAIHNVYADVAQGHPGWLGRTEAWNQRRIGAVAEARGDNADELYVSVRDEVVTGYVHLRRSGEDDDSTLNVLDLAATDSGSELLLWRLLGSSWTVWPRTAFRGLDTTLLHLLLPEVELRTLDDHHRWMTRIVDLAGAIAGRGFPAGLTAAVPLRIDDPWLTQNDGDVVLEVAGGQGAVHVAHHGHEDDVAELGIGHLAALFTGWLSASALVRVGALRGATPAQVAALDAAFAGPVPACPDYF